MTLVIHIGRRVPKAWFKRQAQKVKGLISFQQNMWLMIVQSLDMVKRKANASGKIKFIKTTEFENEDLNYQLEWIKIVIQGTKEQELEEYNDTMKLYNPLNKVMKQEIPKDSAMIKHFKSKVLSSFKVEDAYKQGYGAMGENNIANKLLELGILTHLEIIEDYDSRKEEIKPDF